MRPGKFGNISSLAEYRFSQLKRLDIDFQSGYKQTVEFRQFDYQYGCFPQIYRGIIMTNEYPKGPVLGAFIDTLDCTPTKVIFFDDSRDNVSSVCAELGRRGIKCYGYHYRGTENITGELDVELTQFQFDYLCDNEIWLSEEEAARVVNINLPR